MYTNTKIIAEKNKRVLLLEDEWLIGLDIQETLKRLGFDVDHFGHKEEAKQASKENTYALAILDISQPGSRLGGFEVASLLSGVPIVIASSHERATLESEIKEYDISKKIIDWVIKPYDSALTESLDKHFKDA